jgi:hypothetical protein
VSFLNSAVDAMEHAVELWPVRVEGRLSDGRRSLFVHSDQRLDCIATPAASRSIGDVLAFHDALLHNLSVVVALPASYRKEMSAFRRQSLDRVVQVSEQIGKASRKSVAIPDG